MFFFVRGMLMLKPSSSTMARCACRASGNREGVATGNMLKTELP